MHIQSFLLRVESFGHNINVEIDVEEVIGSENQSVLWELKSFNKKRIFYCINSEYSFYLCRR